MFYSSFFFPPLPSDALPWGLLGPLNPALASVLSPQNRLRLSRFPTRLLPFCRKAISQCAGPLGFLSPLFLRPRHSARATPPMVLLRGLFRPLPRRPSQAFLPLTHPCVGSVLFWRVFLSSLCFSEALWSRKRGTTAL
jgi:hypothetical protein